MKITPSSLIDGIKQLVGIPTFKMGTWARVGDNLQVGRGFVCGAWSSVGDRCTIGHDVHFGEWAEIGDDVILGDGVILGSHTIIQSGVQIVAGTRFDDGDLVTPTGIVKGRVGGFSISSNTAETHIRGSFGRFIVPSDDYSDEMLQDYFWGRSDILCEYRISEPDDLPESLPLQP